MTNLLLVVRFPNGSWSYGGQESDPDYDHCEKWHIDEKDPKKAIKKAQARRRYDMIKQAHSWAAK